MPAMMLGTGVSVLPRGTVFMGLLAGGGLGRSVTTDIAVIPHDARSREIRGRAHSGPRARSQGYREGLPGRLA
ncbi:hypothetical protein ACFFX0_18740 [Citricoccus parietis]|uniref:Uncharacterized protein n=1 Tax=Citricoccus parietis TaxID=592307 RepID=A0ABV5G2G5_9MICC